MWSNTRVMLRHDDVYKGDNHIQFGGSLSAGQRGSEKEVRSCFGTLENNWPGVSAPIGSQHSH